jgi:hypothetical protein
MWVKYGKISRICNKENKKPTGALLKGSSVLAYRIFELLLVVVFFDYVIYCCQYHEPLR